MKTRLTLLFLLFLPSLFAQKTQNNAYQDSITSFFTSQVNHFPQEKIYLQTDKADYTPGERIWFRAYTVDAVFFKQADASRYVYVELIDPRDTVAARVKIRPDSLGLFYGYLPLKEDLEEGNYTLRAYTKYMCNLSEDYFFRKSIYVSHPLSVEIEPEIRDRFDKDKTKLDIAFYNLKTHRKFIPDKMQLFMGENELNLKAELADTIARCSFKLSEKRANNTLLLRLEYKGEKYGRFYSVPSPDDEYDVSFYPEGGSLLLGQNCGMAFKALNADGLSEKVSGAVYDDSGAQIQTFETFHLGMGLFFLRPEAGKKYYAVCKNEKGISKRFELPAALSEGYGLSAHRVHDAWFVSVQKAADTQSSDSLYLLICARGVLIFNRQWDGKSEYIKIDSSVFPSGISNLMLIDSKRNILSERLIFSYHLEDLAKVSMTSPKTNYGSRELIRPEFMITDANNRPVEGNFSISVTDNKDVPPDTASDIVSQLLLSSDLRGNIESPASYIRQDDPTAARALDVLMMTQGWRRYNLPETVKGRIAEPSRYPLETEQNISGKISGKLFTKAGNSRLSLIAMHGSKMDFATATADAKGYFQFKNIEYPDSTKIVVQAKNKKESGDVILSVDGENSPPIDPELNIDGNRPAKPETNYLAKAYDRWIDEKGNRVINLPEVEIEAKRKSPTESIYYSPTSSSKVVTAKDIEDWHVHDLRSLLMRLPGVMVSGDKVSIRGGGTPLFVIDDIPYDNFDLSDIMIEDVDNLFVVKDASAAMFGSKGSNGAIVISTKRGNFSSTPNVSDNIREIIPLGYQQTVEFYSPKYETAAEKSNPAPDRRTTVYWKPDVPVSSDGKASVEFYSADADTDYSVVVNGLGKDGYFIRYRSTISRK